MKKVVFREIRKIVRRLRRSDLKIVRIGNYELYANHDHLIERYLTAYPSYSRNLPRIAKYLLEKYPDYKIIDVGANIGDTVALIRSEGVNNEIHCVEGEKIYFDILQLNSPKFKDVFIYCHYLGKATGELVQSTIITDGTSRLDDHGARSTIQIIKLDDFIARNPLNGIKLLKIDTDGFDFAVIEGSLRFISRSKPVIFFEYDNVFLTENGYDGISTLKILRDMDYHQVMFYDNFGRFLVAMELDNTGMIEQLYRYTAGRKGSFQYYDLCVFHREDDQLAEEIIKKEESLEIS